MCANFTLTKKKPIMGRANFSLARVQADRLYVICVIEYLVFVFFFPVSLADKHKLWSMLGSVFWSCLGRAIVCTFFMRHGLTIIGYLSLSTSSFDQYKIRYYLRIVECSIHVQCLYECNDKRPASVQAGIRLNATAPSSVSGSVSHIGGDGWIIE